jgi:flagellar motility protein MotE (MotC chaperone)
MAANGKYYKAIISSAYVADVTNDANENVGYNGDANLKEDLNSYKKAITKVCNQLEKARADLKTFKNNERTGTVEQEAIKNIIDYIKEVESQLKSKTNKLKSIIEQINTGIEEQNKAWVAKQAQAENNYRVNIDS